MDLHEKQLNMVLDILDKNQLICGPKKGKFYPGKSRILWQFATKWDSPAESREAPCNSEVEAPWNHFGPSWIPWLLQFLPYFCKGFCQVRRPPY